MYYLDLRSNYISHKRKLTCPVNISVVNIISLSISQLEEVIMFCASLSVAKQMSIKVGENLLMAVQTFPGKTHRMASY